MSAASGVRRILLIQDRRLGDVVLSTALLEDLEAAHPDAAIDFLVGAAAAPLLASHPLVSSIVVLDKDDMTGMWRDIRSRGYDLVVDVQGNLRTALITRASGAAVRVGWRGAGRSWCYTHAVGREHERQYVVHDRQRLLQAVGIETAALLPRLQLTEAERAEGRANLAATGVDPARPVVGLMLSSRDPARSWPVPHFVELSLALHAAGLSCVLLPGGDDDARTAGFTSLGGRAGVAPNVSIRPLMGLIAACSVLVSPDSGPAHIATALRVPRVTLYGPSSPLGWSPGLDTTVSLRAGGDAGGPMADLAPATVADAVLRLTARLSSRLPPRAAGQDAR